MPSAEQGESTGATPASTVGVVRRQLRNRAVLRHLLLLAVGVVLFGLFIYLTGVESLRQLGSLAPIPLAGAALATLGITVTIAVRWGTLANALGQEQGADWHDYYHYFLVSRALGFILPKDVTDLGGRTLWLQQRTEMPLARAGTSVVLDRLFDLMAALVFLIAALPFWIGATGAAVSIGLTVLVAAVAGLLLVAGHTVLIDGLIRLLNGILRRLSDGSRLHRYLSALHVVGELDRRTVATVYVLSLFKFLCTTGRFICFALALGIPIAPVILFLGTPVGQLSYAFSVTPGGLGIFEAGWFAILRVADVPTAAASSFVVGQRILTLVLIVIFALLSQALYTAREMRAPTS